MNDLSSLVGFPLCFDSELRSVSTASDMPLDRGVKTAGQMRNILYEPDAAPEETELYYTFHAERMPQAIAETLAKHHLTFSLVLLLPGQVGSEFIKTSGHYHGCIPRTNVACPEIYYQLSGRQMLFLQKPAPNDKSVAIDCALVELLPGTAVEVPPGYLHVLVNNSDQPTLLVGLYRKDMGHDYEPVRAMHGLAYYILNGPQGWFAQANPAYRSIPKLRCLERESTPALAPPSLAMSDFFKYPDKYAFLGDADAVISRYGSAGDAIKPIQQEELRV